MTDRECNKFPYAPLMALIGFLAGVLFAVVRSRRIIPMVAAPHKPAPPKGIPADAIILPESLPTAALPPPGELTIVEGIGAKVEGVLHAAGIHNLQQLARAPAADLKAILVAAGNRISNPETWPRQAELAVAAKWDELKALQASLKAGRQEPKG